MSDVRYARAKEIFLAVSEMTVGGRDIFLRQACGGDDALRAEVESLLSHHEDAATLPARPASRPTAGDPADLDLADLEHTHPERPSEDARRHYATRRPGPPSVGYATRPTGRFEPGEIFAERYRIVALIGRGGMGEVYRAEDLELGEPVALKLLTLTGPEHLEMLRNEVRLARQVTHPNVARVFDVGQTRRGGRSEEERFLTMEWVDGEDLSAVRRRIGRLPPDKVSQIGHQLCAGLAAAHGRGVLHRDLKPGNILLDARGQARITDFGIATAAVSDGVALGPSLVGTPAYMAPEVLLGRPASVRSDIYALGLVLYELVTGRPAFRADTPEQYARLHARVMPEPPSRHAEGLDPRLEDAILRCLEKDPAQRPSSALAVAAALPGGDPLRLALDAGLTPSPEVVAAGRDAPVLTPRHAGIALALLTVLLVLLTSFADRASRTLDPSSIKPPQVLAERAQGLLRELGYPEPADRAWGFLPNLDQLTGQAAHLFWYRESPSPLYPLDAVNIVFFGGRVDLYDPPPLELGMVEVTLDSIGRLVLLEAIPPSRLGEDESYVERLPIDWTPALDAAGFRADAVEPDVPMVLSRGYADTRTAWRGADPRADPNPDGAPTLHIDAAAYRGRITYFDADPAKEDRLETIEVLNAHFELESLLFHLALLGLLITAIWMARRNVRRGRGDLDGARRLVLVVVAARSVGWLLSASHVALLEVEVTNFQIAFGAALAEGLLVWVGYLALEPQARRFWPHVLIAWSRLLSGRFGDPMVGRGLLLGALVGTFWTLLVHLDHLLVLALGLEPSILADRSFPLDNALNPRLPWAAALGSAVDALYFAVAALFSLTILRRFTGRRTAVGIFLVGVAVFQTLPGSHPMVSWLVLGVLGAASSAWLLVRGGLWSYLVALFCSYILLDAPLTTSLDAWFAGAGIFALAVVGGLGVVGTWRALGGVDPRV